MPFEHSIVDPDKDWDELFACEWAAWMNPRQSMWELTFPNLGSGASGEAKAIETAAARQLQDIKKDPSNRWIKMVDVDTGKIVAGALWKFYDSNPYRAPLAKSNATWLPQGELRDLYDSWYAQGRAWPRKVMPVAHARQCFASTNMSDRAADYAQISTYFLHTPTTATGVLAGVSWSGGRRRRIKGAVKPMWREHIWVEGCMRDTALRSCISPRCISRIRLREKSGNVLSRSCWRILWRSCGGLWAGSTSKERRWSLGKGHREKNRGNNRRISILTVLVC